MGFVKMAHGLGKNGPWEMQNGPCEMQNGSRFLRPCRPEVGLDPQKILMSFDP